MAVAALSCPTCQATIEVTPGFTPWCPACNWNVQPGNRDEPSGRLDRAYRVAGRLLGASLHRELVASTTLRPRPSLAFVVATAFAVLVIGGYVAIVALGIATLVSGSNPFEWLAAGIILLFAWACRPRLGSVATEGSVGRSEAPAIWRLVERVAEQLHSPLPDVIVLDGDWNASVATVGWRRRRVLTLGAPMFGALSNEQRVAILGHELGHWVNGDPSRSGLVYVAAITLANAAEALEPEELIPEDPDFGIAGFLALPLNLILLALSVLIDRLARLLVLVVYRDSQRAEYYADRLSTIVAGRDATITTLHAISNTNPFVRAVQGLAISDEQHDLLEVVRRYMAETPSGELERQRRAERLAGTRLDDSHPPTALRIDLVATTGATESAVRVGDADGAAIDRDLARALPAIQSKVIDEARDALYD